ncbi:Transmembrane protein 45B [Holothuria leucospilota]|uniref:Transmembrane protein 45B n=1 Tax=Holothuria leucospilota TaxID=206669 RepID=A0A9Q1HI53_HOLLE|nr:Transmembrane protein 45B [Holothuria leucospilota]
MSIGNVSYDLTEGRGIFIGHVTGGAAHVLVSLVWVLKYHFRTVSRQDDQSEWNRRPLVVNKIFRLIPWEGCIIIFSGSVGVIGGIFSPFFRFRMVGDDDTFLLDSLRGWQHIVYFSSIALYGVVILLADTCFSKLTYYIKPLGSATFALHGTVFALHRSMQNPVDSRIHIIFVVCSYGIAATFALETAFQKQSLYFIMRVFFMVLQGTWMSLSASILDPPNSQQWDGFDKLNIMFVSTIFLILVFIDFCSVVFVFCCISYYIRHKVKRQNDYTLLENGIEMGVTKQQDKIVD